MGRTFRQYPTNDKSVFCQRDTNVVTFLFPAFCCDTRSFQWVAHNVTPGSHTVRMLWMMGGTNRIARPRTAHLSPRSVIIEQANLKHIIPHFGKMLLCDIDADDIAKYQSARLGESASPKTVNLEVGTLRAILRRNRFWAPIQPDIRMLRTREDVGRALSLDEEALLLEACRSSRSRSLFPAVLTALNTCMLYSELRLLRWAQVDLVGCTLTVDDSKTHSGTGRLIPLNDRAVAILRFWAGLFPVRELCHFVFPAERYGASGDGSTVVYESDPTRPIGRWKEAWESAKIRAGVSCRFHDLS
jgi:integrase